MEVVRILAGLFIAYAVALVILFAISDEPVIHRAAVHRRPFSSARRIGSIINLAVPSPSAACPCASCTRSISST